MRNTFGLLLALIPALASALEFAEGDIWSFRGRPNEPKAKFVVAHIERESPEGAVYFVHLLDVKLRLKGPPAPVSAYGAIAVKKSSLEVSAIMKLGNAGRIPYLSAYASWKENLERHKIGAYAMPLIEVEEKLERTVFVTSW